MNGRKTPQQFLKTAVASHAGAWHRHVEGVVTASLMGSQAHWYQADCHDCSHDPIHEAFAEAKRVFKTLSSDPRKQEHLSRATCLEDVQGMVQDLKTQYENTHKSKVRKWLTAFSSRVQYYGNIMDVLVQHHPEYVALAWGAMKMLFVLVRNHDGMVKSLAKGLHQISICLPRMELAAILYPTEKMKSAVAELYARVVRFLIRAQAWYEESKPLHLLHSITRPPELRYFDIMQEIETWAHTVESLASAGIQAETRDMHSKLEKVMRKQHESATVLLEVRQLMIAHQTINSSANLDTSQRLSDIQIDRILDFTSKSRKVEPLKSLQMCTFVNQRHFMRSKASPYPIWLEKKFSGWTERSSSSFIIVRGRYEHRPHVMNLCVNAVRVLMDSTIPVVWILRDNEQAKLENVTTVSVLQDIVCQVLRLNVGSHTERAFTSCCTKFRCAQTEKQWLDLLGLALSGLPQVYIIIDLETLFPRQSGNSSDFLWNSAFLSLFNDMKRRGSTTIVKLILVSCRSEVPLDLTQEDLSDSMISIRRTSIRSASMRAVNHSVRKKPLASLHAQGARFGRGGLPL